MWASCTLTSYQSYYYSTRNDDGFVRLSRRMYGVTIHQAYRYFRLYPTDRPVLRAIVSYHRWFLCIYSPSRRSRSSLCCESCRRSKCSPCSLNRNISLLDTFHTVIIAHTWCVHTYPASGIGRILSCSQLPLHGVKLL